MAKNFNNRALKAWEIFALTVVLYIAGGLLKGVIGDSMLLLAHILLLFSLLAFVREQRAKQK